MADYNEVVSSLPYFGNIQFYAYLAQGDMLIDVYEHYEKQSLRNRCELCDSQGKFSLTVPVNRLSGVKIATKEIKIDHTEDWQHDHTHAIKSAYGSSPFFIHYWDKIEAVIQEDQTNLIDLNIAAHEVVASFLGMETPLRFTDEYIESTPGFDLRPAIKKKRKDFQNQRYIQVFSDRMGFINNRSILDLLFCEGPASIDYLLKQELQF